MKRVGLVLCLCFLLLATVVSQSDAARSRQDDGYGDESGQDGGDENDFGGNGEQDGDMGMDAGGQDGQDAQGPPIDWRNFYGILTAEKVVRNKKEAIFLWEKVFGKKNAKQTMSENDFDQFTNQALNKILAKWRQKNAKDL